MHAFCNQAMLSYNNIVMNSNAAQGCYKDPLSIVKSAVCDSYTTGDAITYSISIVNSSAKACSGLTLHDDLGAYSHSSGALTPLTYIPGTLRIYQNGELLHAPDVCAGPPMVISGISVPACGNVLILYSARANQYAPIGASGGIINTSRLSGSSLAAPVQASAGLRAANSTLLSISKALCPSVITGSEPLCCTIIIQNSGSAAVTEDENVIITDVFEPIINISGVCFNGTPWTCPENYSYNPATGLFTTGANQISVPAACYTQNMSTGIWTTTPGTSTLTITGSICNAP